jgi:site-specific recombinase XerD
LYQGYYRELTEIRHAPKGTRQNWTCTVRRFLHADLPISAEGFRTYLASLKVGPTTKSSYLCALKSFARYLHEQELLSELEMLRIQRIRGPRGETTLRSVLSKAEVDTLIHTATPMRPAAFRQEICQLRDAALIDLFYATGLRLSELVSLDLGCMRPTQQKGTYLVQVVRKKKGVGPCYCNERAFRTLSHYLHRRPELCHPRTGYLHPRALFVGNMRGDRLNTKEAYSIVVGRGRAAGIAVHPHALRHSFATHLDESGVTTPSLKALMGHKSIRSTETYTHPNQGHLARVYHQHHPAAQEVPPS